MSYYKDNKKQMYADITDTLRIFRKWSKRGLIFGQIKEKYYSTRWYANLCTPLSLHTLFYPGHYYYRFPKWFRKFDNFSEDLFQRIGLNYLLGKWQVFCYRQAYKDVLTKYPHLDHCIDHPELVKEWMPEEDTECYERESLK